MVSEYAAAGLSYYLVEAITDLGMLIVAIAAVWYARKTIVKDHERRKKQATLEYYHQVSVSITVPLRRILENNFAEYMQNQTAIPSSLVDPLDADIRHELLFLTVQWHRSMERLSIGISTGIYDFDIFYRCAGISTKRLYVIVSLIAKQRADYTSDARLDVEFRKLIVKIGEHEDKKLCSREGEISKL